MDSYDFLAPTKIAFGWGRRSELGELARPLGRRAWMVCGSRTLLASPLAAGLFESLGRAGIETVQLASIGREPLVEDVDAAVARWHEQGGTSDDLILAIGGGSAIDLAKAVAALATNVGSVRDCLEGVGRGLQLTHAPLAVVAVPTTAGTGSEATKNAVISSFDPPFKKSLRHDVMIPRLVLIDPELTTSLPAETTKYTGLDAITQLIESYISRRARLIPRALARGALPTAVEALPIAVHDPGNRQARCGMSHAALVSGMCLANSGLGMAHGVAAALGIHARLPHGLACAVMLPTALRANRRVAEEPLAELGRALGYTGDRPAAAADFLIERIVQLCRELQIPSRLSALGARAEQLDLLVRDARGNSMAGNPREISDSELRTLLEQLF